MSSDFVVKLAEELNDRNKTIATAESCTGGLIGASFTSLPGSSNWYLGGFITYTNDMKEKFLGVSPLIFEKYGAVSEECAKEMVIGTRDTTGADYAISVTGIAGPGGGTLEKPVGLVYIAVTDSKSVIVSKNLFVGDRESVRFQAREKALSMILNLIS